MTRAFAVRTRIKWLLFPGLNLHARLRSRVLPRYFRNRGTEASYLVLDAGCGNGMLSHKSYSRGNCVVGVSIKPGEVARNQLLFNGWLGVPEQRLRFDLRNLYELPKLNMTFDEIICSEVLEHISDDHHICQLFYDSLSPGGILHLCCPNADHPDNRKMQLDPAEGGGHVRPGYTAESYRALLEPIGFRIEQVLGLGGAVRQWCNRRITAAQEIAGLPFGLLVFCLLGPLVLLDSRRPRIPYSLYVRAVKPEQD